jgi:hypothetical protein
VSGSLDYKTSAGIATWTLWNCFRVLIQAHVLYLVAWVHNSNVFVPLKFWPS